MRRTKFGAVARRRWWVVLLLGLLGAGAAYGAGTAVSPAWTTTAVLLVHSGEQLADGTFVDNPNDAVRRASTYSELLTRDDQLLRAAAERAGVQPEVYEEQLAVDNVVDAALVEVTVTADSSDEAAGLLDAFVGAAIEPATSSIEPGTIELIRVVPPEADRVLTSEILAVAGGLLGVFLGVAVVVFTERSDPRIDVVTDVQRLIDLPVSTRADYRRSRAAIERRWDTLGGHGSDVVLVGVGRADPRAVLGGNRSPDEAATLNGSVKIVDPSSPDFVDARVVVVVVPRGMRASELCDDLDRFGALGSPARWVILGS